jgi:hypothetical protein
MNLLKTILSVYILAILSCNRSDVIDKNSVFEKASKRDSLAYYFPSILNDTFDRRNDEFQDYAQKSYSSTLYSFKEPILYTKTDKQTIYRLLWLRAFHKPVCFTMKESNGEYFLNAKTLDRLPLFFSEVKATSKDENGKWILDTIQKADRYAKIDFSIIKRLSSRQWRGIEDHISEIDFWNTPILDSVKDDSTDGSSWALEGLKNGKYHFITRRNAREKFGDYLSNLIEWSGLKINDDSIY